MFPRPGFLGSPKTVSRPLLPEAPTRTQGLVSMLSTTQLEASNTTQLSRQMLWLLPESFSSVK